MEKLDSENHENAYNERMRRSWEKLCYDSEIPGKATMRMLIKCNQQQKKEDPGINLFEKVLNMHVTREIYRDLN